MKVAYYVSGHGQGHARRSNLIIQGMLQLDPELEIYVRTLAPSGLFQTHDRLQFCPLPQGSDFTVMEDDILSINPAATIESLIQFEASLTSGSVHDLNFIREKEIDAILADAPFWIGPTAQQAGIPCYAITNFTWDLILEPFLNGCPRKNHLLSLIRTHYEQMSGLFKLPLDAPLPNFRKVRDLPLLAQTSPRTSAETRAAFGWSKTGKRPRIFFALRGLELQRALSQAAQKHPEWLFYSLEKSVRLPNVTPAEFRPGADYIDWLKATDLTVCKPGYGILSDVIAAQARLLCPHRSGFKEDEYTETSARQLACVESISRTKFFAGDWDEEVETLLRMPGPKGRIEIDSGLRSARTILQTLQEDVV